MRMPWSRRRFVGSALQGAASVGALRLGGDVHTVIAAPPPTQGIPPLPSEQRTVLLLAMDEIVPAGAGMPSASQAACLDYLAGVSQQDDRLRAELVKSLDATQAAARAGFGRDFSGLGAEERIAALRNLEGSDPVLFRSLRDAVYEAYYTRPEVWKRLGHEFYPPARPGPLPPPFDDSVVTRVRQMPRLYRVIDG